MYRQYRALPEGNRICMKAARDRAYQQHLLALKKMKPTINNQRPNIPQTIGRNYKRYEMEKQRNNEIARENDRILKSIQNYQKEEHYPRNVSQRPFTLQGKAQKQEMSRITYENHKLLAAVQERKSQFNRNDWLKLRLDHQYQIAKMSEYKKTVPMSDILKQEVASSYKRSQSKLNNSSYTSASENRSKTSLSHFEMEKENEKSGDTQVGDDGMASENNSKGRLEQINESNTDALLSNDLQKDNQNSNIDDGKLEDLNSNFANSLLSDKKDDNKQEEEEGVLENQSNDIANGLIG